MSLNLQRLKKELTIINYILVSAIYIKMYFNYIITRKSD